MSKTLSLHPDKSLNLIGTKLDSTIEVIIPNTEIIKLNDEIISYPCDRLVLDKNKFINIELQKNDADPRKPKSNDKAAHLYKLFPPIIVNLRATEGSNNGFLLADNQIEYFRRQKIPAIIFIHGFNIAHGAFSQQIIGINNTSTLQTETDLQNRLEPNANHIIRSPSLSTILRTTSSIEQQFKKTNVVLTDEQLNGTGAHNWFIHMEDNINKAANKTNKNNYLNYFRLIHLSWPGDVMPLAYLEAEEKADQAAISLVKIATQLNQEKIPCYVIAHSLGNRVLLRAMQTLAENSYNNLFKQVFLWQAAVPYYALSNKITLDNSVKFNDHFPEAYLSAERMTVLYSSNDRVLAYEYWLANRLGMTPRELFNSERFIESIYRSMDENYFEFLTNIKLLEGDLKILDHISRDEVAADCLLRTMKELYRFSQTAQAMGYRGVDLSDPFMQNLINTKKLIVVNQPFLENHSSMKIPNETMMNLVYRRWIVNKKYGITLDDVL